jgi:3-hydroxyacyl-[acyl-carrier-protein] dehydratase
MARKKINMTLNQKQIREILKQRYPFLLVDKIIELNDEYICGIKNVSATDPFLMGHFPDNPIYPGVLLIETCSQVGGILVSKYMKGNGYIASIKDFKFINFIEPGDTIIIEVNFISKFGKFANIKATAKVDDKIVGKGEIIYSFINN